MSIKEHFEALWSELDSGDGTLAEAVIGMEIDGTLCRFFMLGEGLDLAEVANRVSSFTYMNDKNGQHVGNLVLTLPASYQEKFKAQEEGFFELSDLAAAYDPNTVAHGLCVRFVGSGAPSYDKAWGVNLWNYMESCGLHVH